MVVSKTLARIKAITRSLVRMVVQETMNRRDRRNMSHMPVMLAKGMMMSPIHPEEGTSYSQLKLSYYSHNPV